MRKLFEINVLDTKYTVYQTNDKKDKKLKQYDAYVNLNYKRIIIDETKDEKYKQRLLAHELVHVFLYESGLDDQCWAANEEIVDWIALQTFKVSDKVKESIKLLKKGLKENVQDKKRKQ